jgi:hypothetical protein
MRTLGEDYNITRSRHALMPCARRRRYVVFEACHLSLVCAYWPRRGGIVGVVTWEMHDGGLAATHRLPDVGTSWEIEGTHDFDSDGDSDVLWRNDTGQVVVWGMQDGDLFRTESFGIVANVWQVVGTGEFS